MALVASLPSQCVKPVGAQVHKLYGFTFTEWAAYACKNAVFASSVARLYGERPQRLTGAKKIMK